VKNNTTKRRKAGIGGKKGLQEEGVSTPGMGSEDALKKTMNALTKARESRAVERRKLTLARSHEILERHKKRSRQRDALKALKIQHGHVRGFKNNTFEDKSPIKWEEATSRTARPQGANLKKRERIRNQRMMSKAHNSFLSKVRFPRRSGQGDLTTTRGGETFVQGNGKKVLNPSK